MASTLVSNDKTRKYNLTLTRIISTFSVSTCPLYAYTIKGYNGLRNGLYGYSWDMMVYNVDIAKIQVEVLDHGRHEHLFLDSQVIYNTRIYANNLLLISFIFPIKC